MTAVSKHETDPPAGSRQAAALHFRVMIRRSNELHAIYLKNSERLEQYDRFTRWQMNYLKRFFVDLYECESYADAIDFTISDLAGTGISDRDRDLERAAPAINRLLPGNALETIATAAELNARVLEINIRIFERLTASGSLPADLTDRDYCVACRKASTLEACLELVHLVTNLGGTLKTLANVSLLRGLLRTMRRPARVAGFGALQEFLETGYNCFRAIPDIDHLLEEIENRMTAVFETIYTTPLRELDGTVDQRIAAMTGSDAN